MHDKEKAQKTGYKIGTMLAYVSAICLMSLITAGTIKLLLLLL